MSVWATPSSSCIVLMVMLLAVHVGAQSNPCTNNGYAIQLPNRGQCLIPTYNAKDWLQAEASCEQSGGRLFDPGEAGGLAKDGLLASCLRASLQNQQRLAADDFWAGVVSKWSQQWTWVNGTLVSPIQHVTTDRQAFNELSSELVCGRYLSVEECVVTCFKDGAPYPVLKWRDPTYVCCNCFFRLDSARVSPAPDRHISHYQNDSDTYCIAAALKHLGNTVRVTTEDSYSERESLCATVNTQSLSDRTLSSQRCFFQAPFLCSVDNTSSTQCDEKPQCQGTQCKIQVGDSCVQRDSRPMTWLQARSQCRAAGGDLWTVDKMDDLAQVSRMLHAEMSYWVGASNHEWIFNPASTVFGIKEPDYGAVRCGHMIVEQPGDTTAHEPQWKWSDTQCDQQKSYICQYDRTSFTPAEREESVICPWEIPVTAAPVSGGTSTPPSTDTVIHRTPSPQAAVSTSSSYPVVPIVAACVAALVILLCAILLLGYTRRRKRLMKKRKETDEYVWPFYIPSPMYLVSSPTSDPGLDISSSDIRSGMQSDAGSVFLFPDPVNPNNTTRNSSSDQLHSNGSVRLVKARRQRSRTDRADSKRSDYVNGSMKPRLYSINSINSRASRDGEVTLERASAFSDGGAGAEILEEEIGESRPRYGSFTDDRFSSSTYTPLSPRSQEYSTLTASMKVRDDLDTPINTLRGKPEVALVTDDVNMNFTVNHAFPRSLLKSRDGSERSDRSSQREVSEVDLPMESTVQIPIRIPPHVEPDVHY